MTGTWTLHSDGISEEIEAADKADARAQAISWVEDGDWDLSSGTIWVEVSYYEHDWDDRNSVVVALQPVEPDCTETNHDWQSPWRLVGGLKENPGVQGNGGGVVIEEVCMSCGTAVTTDTWAQDCNGRQGLTSVGYEEGKYADDLEEPDCAETVDPSDCDGCLAGEDWSGLSSNPELCETCNDEWESL